MFRLSDPPASEMVLCFLILVMTREKDERVILIHVNHSLFYLKKGKDESRTSKVATKNVKMTNGKFLSFERIPASNLFRQWKKHSRLLFIINAFLAGVQHVNIIP